MPSERRDLISDLYYRALARAPEARGAFLTEACNGDEGLRQEVESLLEYETASARFLERPAAGVAAPTTGVTSMIDRQLGPYTITAPLGAGGMGEVYRARDSKLGRDVAIKILPAHFTADPERRARFAREARLLATLNHPHIGAIYGLEEADDITGLVLELVEGPTLADRLERGPLPLSLALTIARQIADALDAAHAKGIVHRDLKPANIVLQAPFDGVSSDVRARVLDFGLAKPTAVELAADPTAAVSGSFGGTADGRILGTPAYMSPEQARGLIVDKRTDIWAFGCVLYEMLTGRRTFEGDTVTDTFARILDHEPDWAALPATTPATIRTLLHRCLRKDPRTRLHDVADARLELDEVDQSSSAGAPPARAGARRTREPLAWVIAAAFGVAAVVLALLYGRVLLSPPSATIEFPLAPPDQWFYSGGQDLNLPDFAIAPDGRHLALVAATRDVSMLWIRPTTGLKWSQLAGTEGAFGPFWSADSQSVGFFADGRLKVVHLAGGQPVELCEAPGNNASSATWGRNQDIVFGANGALQKIPSRGGQPVPVTTLQNGESAHLWPSFLPDGRSFLYLAQRPGASELRVGSLTSAEHVSLGPFESGAVYVDGHLLFVRGGALMAQRFDTSAQQLIGVATGLADRTAVVPPYQRGLFGASADVLGYSASGRSPSYLTWFDRRGTPLGTAGDAGFYVNLDLSPDDQRLAVSRLTEQPDGPNVDIWLIDLAKDGRSERLTNNPAMDWDPAWSPDGSEIAFNSNRDGGIYSLFRRSASGGGKDELLFRPAIGVYAPDWSPDGSLIYDEDGGDTRNDLWIHPMSGNRKLFLGERFAERNGALSPDGRWMAYQSDETGRPEVYVRRFPDQRGRHSISRNGGRAPRWGRDGRELFFIAPDGTMMAAAIDPSNDFQASVPRPLFKTGLLVTANNNPYVVTRDGQRFLVPVAVDPPGAARLTIVLNWRAKLRGQ